MEDDDDDGGDPVVNSPLVAERAVEHAQRCVRQFLRGESRIGSFGEDDLIQEVLLAFLRALNRSSAVLSLEMFIRHITRCTVTSIMRREILRRGVPIEGMELEAARQDSMMEAMDELSAIAYSLHPFNLAVIATVTKHEIDLNSEWGRELVCEELNISRDQLRASIARIRAAARARDSKSD